MLDEFITTYRDAIIERARQKLTARPWPPASERELENGVPLFLTQLSNALRFGIDRDPTFPSRDRIDGGHPWAGTAGARVHGVASRARLWGHLPGGDGDRH